MKKETSHLGGFSERKKEKRYGGATNGKAAGQFLIKKARKGRKRG